MPNIISFLVAVACLFNLNLRAQPISDDIHLGELQFSDVALLQHIQTLSSDSFEGRKIGSKGGIKARQYIINQFHTLDVQPLGSNYEQSFSSSSYGKTYRGANVLGYIKGSNHPEKYIVISAHYDHEGIKKGKTFNGADDNASGISALFSFAEYFKNHPPKHSVILAAFDGEELGLKGSKYFVNNSKVPLKQIRVNLNMDMISRSNNNELYVVGTRHNESLKHIISKFQQPKKLKLLIGFDGENSREDWTHSSDHASFHKKGIPFLYFGVEDHEDYHTPTDDYENIHPEFYTEAVHVIISVFKKVDALQIRR
jgi:Zn-dependent M28 family amino/carboxypeptidase